MNKSIIVELFGKKYNLTEFAEIHPGGKDVLLEYNGKDASDAFYDAGHFKNHGILQQLSEFEVKKYDPKL